MDDNYYNNYYIICKIDHIHNMSGTVHVWRTLRSSHPQPGGLQRPQCAGAPRCGAGTKKNNLRVFVPSNWPDSIKNPVKKYI